MKNKFLEPSIEVLKFSCETTIEGSPDAVTDKNGDDTIFDGDNL